ncbi:multifunctional CCA addition/repair protein [Panacagrimonas sp.]|uniref:multifunctional CCA addition/repair protein n=1 Tax=Panacagrimonas sp. TaxID=2480088 RepID=UPI003B52F6C1
MKTYLVGGAVRDRLLGLPVSERDWVVVGATPEDMIAQGYRPVGKDFPVFLHPQTREEHALARTERKSGHGYHGFTFHTGPEVSLEDDLWRRDLTINAIAEDAHGRLVDPHGGRQDLDARLLRHVSPAFAEDPLRVLRIARFAARFAPLGFRIADETQVLMREMVAAGEVDHLVAERVWKETERALIETQRAGLPAPAFPSVYFRVLHDCGALARVMPELAALHGVPQRADYHPEVDTLIHTLMCVDAAVRAGHGLDVRVAALLHDLGKAVTPSAELPRHIGHEHRGVPLVRQFCERLRVPANARDLALVVTREHLLVHRVRELRAITLLELLERLDAFRRPERFELALQGCECDARGRLGFENCEYPQTDWLRQARLAAQVSNADVLADGFSGAAVGEEIRRRRLARLADWKQIQG